MSLSRLQFIIQRLFPQIEANYAAPDAGVHVLSAGDEMQPQHPSDAAEELWEPNPHPSRSF